jgi:hypothetical protein
MTVTTKHYITTNGTRMYLVLHPRFSLAKGSPVEQCDWCGCDLAETMFKLDLYSVGCSECGAHFPIQTSVTA